jgi:hypothetical protein
MFLKHADVHISNINSRAFYITTTQESYKLARSILLILKNKCALPLHLHSEEVSERVKANAGSSATLKYSAGTIFEENLPPRYGNLFLVSGHILVGEDRNKIIVLANEVADNLKSFGLSVIVHT